MDYPKRYYARHIKEGLVHYLEDGNDILYLIKNDALIKMNASFEGKPIYINHVENNDNMERDSVGYVVKSFYNKIDGSWWAELIINKAGQEYVDKGWAVSNAYTPTEYGAGGEYHDIPYKKEVLNGKYEHLALTSAPRYEEAVIMTPEEYKEYNEGKKTELEKLNNSKEKVNMISEEEKKELLDSLKNSLSEVVKDTVKNALCEKFEEDKKNAEEEDHRKLIREIAAVAAKPEADFEGGVEEQVRTVIGLAEKLGYTRDEADNSKNSEDEDKAEEKKDEAEEESKENEEEEKKEEEKKENSKFFNFLHNAKANDEKRKTISTMASGLALGRARYGSK